MKKYPFLYKPDPGHCGIIISTKQCALLSLVTTKSRIQEFVQGLGLKYSALLWPRALWLYCSTLTKSLKCLFTLWTLTNKNVKNKKIIFRFLWVLTSVNLLYTWWTQRIWFMMFSLILVFHHLSVLQEQIIFSLQIIINISGAWVLASFFPLKYNPPL